MMFDDENDNKKLISSDYVSKSKTFKTEKEARAWYDVTKIEMIDKGFIVRDTTNDMWSIPPLEKSGEDWTAYVEAELIVWEDIPQEVTVETTQ